MRPSTGLFVMAFVASCLFGAMMFYGSPPQAVVGAIALAVVWALSGAAARDFGH